MSNLNGFSYPPKFSEGELRRIYHFQPIEDGKFYKSAQPDESFLSYLEKAYKIKTIIDLRSEIEDFEERFAKNYRIYLVHIPLMPFWRNPNKEKVSSFLNLFRDPQKLPVLLHCRKGKDRSGVMLALFRLLYQNWPIQKVLWEMEQNKVNLYWRFFIKWKSF